MASMLINYGDNFMLTFTGEVMFFKCCAQESHYKFSITNQKDEILGNTLQTWACDHNRQLD
jgi:hypothetical protein